MKKSFRVALVALLTLPIIGCSMFGDLWDHTKWHLHGAYQAAIDVGHILYSVVFGIRILRCSIVFASQGGRDVVVHGEKT